MFLGRGGEGGGVGGVVGGGGGGWKGPVEYIFFSFNSLRRTL